MARRPRTSIPETSGAGVARYSYQHAYALGQRGTGGGPLKKIPEVKLNDKYGKGSRRPGDLKIKADKEQPWNISYGDTWGDGSQ